MTTKTNEEWVEELQKLIPEDLDIDYEKPYKEILKPTLYSEELWPESKLEIDSYKLVDYIITLLTAKDKEREEAVKHARKVTSIEALETLHNAFFTPKMHVAIEEDGSMFLVPIEPDTQKTPAIARVPCPIPTPSTLDQNK